MKIMKDRADFIFCVLFMSLNLVVGRCIELCECFVFPFCHMNITTTKNETTNPLHSSQNNREFLLLLLLPETRLERRTTLPYFFIIKASNRDVHTILGKSRQRNEILSLMLISVMFD